MKQLIFILMLAAAPVSFVYSGETCSRPKCPHDEKAQRSLPVTKNHYFSTGSAFIGNGDVNDHLDKLGFDTFSRYGLSLGFGHTRQYRRFIHGHELEALIWKRNRDDNVESDFSVGRFTALFGVSLLSGEKFALFPLVGIGAGITSIKAGPKEVPFDSAFAIPSQLPPTSPLYQGTFIIDAGLGIRFTPSLPARKHGKFTIGLRAGYVFDPVDNQRWYRNGVRLSGGPDSNLSGAYVRLSIGKTRTGGGNAEGGCPHCKGNGTCRGGGTCPQKSGGSQQ